MEHCPKCKSERIHRSRARTKWEAWRKEVTAKRLFRCHDCGWRGWSSEIGPSFDSTERARATLTLAPPPPNLRGTLLARGAGPADIDLNALDADIQEASGNE